ncbi:winged helix-turn-helix transcriptional regulator [Mesorhizobium sp. B3-1-6]|nr:winged helix-turn-helix transcriptional regulator [Mesorhizobium sp. B3-1-6]
MVQLEQDGVARRIIAAIKEQIHSGGYRPGDRLPSTRAFATEWGASRTTVTAAYNQLDAEGYLIIRHGARAIVAPGLERASGEAPVAAASPRNLSAFARRLLALPAPTVAGYRRRGRDWPACRCLDERYRCWTRSGDHRCGAHRRYRPLSRVATL